MAICQKLFDAGLIECALCQNESTEWSWRLSVTAVGIALEIYDNVIHVLLEVDSREFAATRLTVRGSYLLQLVANVGCHYGPDIHETHHLGVRRHVPKLGWQSGRNTAGTLRREIRDERAAHSQDEHGSPADQKIPGS
jgi:hypothetical protein